MIRALRTFRVRPLLPEELRPLATLAMNLRWAWDDGTQEVFRWVEPGLWQEVGGNPVALLGRLSPERIRQLAGDAAFLSELTERHDSLQRYLTLDRWAQQRGHRPPRVAYFSPEFGLTHAMQTYSGGLGVLAGDHLKAASDLGLELVGVGLLYRHGYFRQHLDADGWQQERYPDLNPYTLPVRRLERDGAPAVVEVDLAGHAVQCQIWKAEVGRVPLFLLDTDLPANAPSDRSVTDRLYGGDNEHRLRQEIVLGIGGMRGLDAAIELDELAWQPEIYHSNEGHAGFLQLERVRRLVADEKMAFDDAMESARSTVLFTTHTPVPAGIDRFPRPLMEQYFSALAHECDVTMDRLMQVGQLPGAGPETEFNMALMALRLSACANGVSQLHGHVARGMFAGLWPGITVDEVPIAHVTNGVHAPSWVGREMRAVFDRHLPPDWPLNAEAWERVGEIGDDVLWRARVRARERLVQHVREAVRAQRQRRGESADALGWVDQLLDPDALTIGFARRFAEYKRGTLLLRQPERLRQLLSSDRPVQLVFAGKAHPRDEGGKDLIRQITHFSDDPELRTRMVFLEDYDIELAQVLFQGSDVWLNTPRRPYEACGTSGQKAVLNGALHCSTLDGWWNEMWDGENGFAIGGTDDYPDTAQQDTADAHSLFEVLEWSIIPMFYERGADRLPRRWLGRIRRSLETLAPRVLASRMLEEYTTRFYVPVAERAGRLTEDGYRRARDLAAWRRLMAEGWGELGATVLSSDGSAAGIGETRAVEVLVQLGSLRPEDVRVELLHGVVTADGMLASPQVEELTLQKEGRDGHRYQGAFVCQESGEYGVAVRVVPHNDDLLTWADTGLATWAVLAPSERSHDVVAR